ncbi:lanthionine synthetase LanC family protein [Olivibacter domesticus]|uniref:Serine/threonine protein kinase n=1 Tax=Olivibacter domesticus TaxID=407022 RepID=A0A1H7IGW0_OLID1|nr:lanthionine synthetase LanC family protein [Olivibacter domesticus]SEK61783.1 Serine/threonine protein kinase [Olivibacter domesticus]
MHNEVVATMTADFTEIIKENGLDYKLDSFYLEIGEPLTGHGWKLYVSVILTQVSALVEKIIPVLKKAGVYFRIARDMRAAEGLLDGKYGPEYLNRVVCIYPKGDNEALELANVLIAVTADYKGPAILDGIRLSGPVFTSYGHFHEYIDGEDYIVKLYETCKKNPRMLNTSSGLTWPFSPILKISDISARRLYKKRIKFANLIKDDFRGNVYRAVYVKSWLSFSPCIIKEGKQYMCSDEHGRDIQDRLKWQLKLHQELGSFLPLPNIIDFFYDEGDAYFVMEFIDSVALEDKVQIIYDGSNWTGLNAETRRLLTDYLMKIIRIISVLHSYNIVHRDITASNFLILKNGTVKMIDLELCYSLITNEPYPPFSLGTMGYMSPEQQKCSKPTIKEDIYGLGGLMIVIFTGLLPKDFEASSGKDLCDSLYHFIKDRDIADLISACMKSDPALRPELETVQERLKNIQEHTHDKTRPEIISESQVLNRKEANSLVDLTIASLSSIHLTDKHGLWFSKVSEQNALYGHLPDLYNGTAGVFYGLFRLKEAGYQCSEILKQRAGANLEYLQREGFGRLQEMSPGLYNGKGGLGVLLASGISCGYFEKNDGNLALMEACFHESSKNLNLSAGIAGAGIGLLQCTSFLPSNFLKQQLGNIVDQLLTHQSRDGSWETAVDRRIETGIVTGVSGIVYFLLCFGRFYAEEKALTAATRGLEWLQRQSGKRGQSIFWYTDSKRKEVDPWFNNGIAGIALTFLKAYQIFRKPVYRQICESALKSHKSEVIYRNTSQASGIAGLGEVYLEAYQVLESEEWKTRADWIAGSLYHLRKKSEENTYYWLTDHFRATPDFMTGNIGITYFLARWLKPDKLSFPVLGDS